MLTFSNEEDKWEILEDLSEKVSRNKQFLGPDMLRVFITAY